jgi:hypothetical protein
MQMQQLKNANNTATQYSNLAFEEIFSDNYTTDGPRLLSRSQQKLQSQRLKKQKDQNEKQK